MEPLSFLGDLLPLLQPIRDLIEFPVDGNDAVPGGIPLAPGAYILMSRSVDITFRYPRDHSQVFYIGQSGNLRRRLGRHKNRILSLMRHSSPAPLYRPVHEYGAAHGVYFSWITAPDLNFKPRELEDRLLAKFARRYRCIPVANGAASWRRLRGLIDLDTDDLCDPSEETE